MMLTLDNLAHRYGLLPSEALSRGDTLDLHILDLGMRWSNRQNTDQKTVQPKLSEDEMKKLIKDTKERKRDINKHKNR